jgi:hypothetical protein
MAFEREDLRRNFDPTNESDGTWRIKTNDELLTYSMEQSPS